MPNVQGGVWVCKRDAIRRDALLLRHTAGPPGPTLPYLPPIWTPNFEINSENITEISVDAVLIVQCERNFYVRELAKKLQNISHRGQAGIA